jgi:hypothetical protein
MEEVQEVQMIHHRRPILPIQTVKHVPHSLEQKIIQTPQKTNRKKADRLGEEKVKNSQ